MPANTLPTSSVADLMYTPLVTVYQMLTKPDIQPVLPPPASNGGTRNFTERQTMLMMLAGDMVRSGMKFPLAARWACRIAEQLLFDPEASFVHIEFRRNGALFCFTTDLAPEAAYAAGPACFRTTFDLNAYRAAIRAAMADA
ncbi:MAG: hypothetical protein ACK4TC_11310 [Sphingomonas pseudosanguinis]|jgi:hypothetical protein|uniref:hypothetical protein n=1 Tax=Sphingomonas pseudosanguinis TaxID=413712 RepID=UPI00391CE5F3